MSDLTQFFAPVIFDNVILIFISKIKRFLIHFVTGTKLSMCKIIDYGFDVTN